jgi:CRP-like cAMP-binding protein
MKSTILAVVYTDPNSTALLEDLARAEINLLLCRDAADAGLAGLALVFLEDIAIHQKPSTPWLAWDQTGSSDAITNAYRAGARSVFPKETPVHVVVETVRRTMDDLSRSDRSNHPRRQKDYSRGELILLEADEVLRVDEGILATTMVHQDGIEVLIGLSGKGQIIVAHPNDNCHIQIIAHTDTKVQIDSWESASAQPDFSTSLRGRLQQMEGWAAMRARPSLQGRVLRLLELLSDQFGVPVEGGLFIDVRITHSQLAAAVGATRTSITRALSELRALGRISTVARGSEDFFCLTGKTDRHTHI